MLPKDWKRSSIGEIARIDARILPANSPESFCFRYISLSDVIGRRISPQLMSYAFSEAPSRARRLLKFNDILFSTVRPNLLGHAMVTHDFSDCVASTGFSVLTASPSTDSRYVYQYLFSRHIQRQIDALVVGSSFPAIGSNDLSALEINLPPLAVQKRVADILTTWDQAIATTEQLLTNSRRQWHALISATLHLPTANPGAITAVDNGGFPASVQPGIPTLPPTPAGWRLIHLRDHLTEVRRPVALKDAELYTLVTVKRSRGGVAQREVLRGSEVKTQSQFHVRTGDFLISKRQIVHGACGIVPLELDGAVVSNEYAVLNSDGEIDLKFLRYLSETRYFQQTCFHSSIGVHVEKMIFKTDRWLGWPFNLPTLERQQ